MKARRLSLIFAMALATAPALAYAQSHGHSGGNGGGGHSGSNGGGGHSGGGGGSHAVPRTNGYGGSTPQGRHPQAGTGYRYGYGHGHYGYGHGYYGHGYYPYYPYYGYGYGYPYWGWGGSIGFYYGGGPYYDGGYYGGGYGGDGYYGGGYSAPYSAEPGSVKLLVDPEDTKVYVDGYYSGTVDDYDGFGQHLDLPPGKHEIALRLDGYQSQRFKVYASPDNTLKIHYTMVKGTGDAPEEIVVGDPSAEQYSRNERRRYEDDRMAADRPQGDRYADHPSDRSHVQLGSNDRPRSSAPRDEGATLRLRITPVDASVYVDGRFYGTGRDSSRLDLAPGRHRVEVVRPGYHTYDSEVEVGGDAPTEVEITLERGLYPPPAAVPRGGGAGAVLYRSW